MAADPAQTARDPADPVGERLDEFLEDGRRGHRTIYRHLPELLEPGEEVLVAGLARSLTPEGRPPRDARRRRGYLVLTDRRLLLIGAGAIGGPAGGVRAVPRHEVLGADARRRFLTDVIGERVPLRLQTSHGVLEFRVTPKEAADRIVAHLAEPTPPPDAPTPSDDRERLAVGAAPPA
jgi:hypothetical protein